MVSLKVACLLVCVALVAGQLVGGPQQADTNDPGTQEAEKLAKERIVTLSGVCEQGVTLTDAKRQTVNGVKYTFTYEANPTTCGQNGTKKTCTVEVYDNRAEKKVQNESCK